MDNYCYIIGVRVNHRVANAVGLQEVLTKYGCNIKLRVGLHETSEKFCADDGVIMLQVCGEKGRSGRHGRRAQRHGGHPRQDARAVSRRQNMKNVRCAFCVSHIFYTIYTGKRFQTSVTSFSRESRKESR